MILQYVLLTLLASVAAQSCLEWVDVQAGGTCWQIANDHGLDVDGLLAINSGLNCNALQIGQKICVKASSDKPECTGWYTVNSGDYCYKIWTDNGLSETIFRELNEDLDCDKLNVGDKLCISNDSKLATTSGTTETPTTTTAPRTIDDGFCTDWTLVKQGGSCWQIANDFNVAIDFLKSINPIMNCDSLQIGDSICLGTSSIRPPCVKFFTVSTGKTCANAWAAGELTETQFKNLNPDVDCDSLQEGDKLCISVDPSEEPSEEPEVDKDGCGEFYLVKSGDTCYSISVAFGLDLTKLTNAVNCNSLNVGDKICIAAERQCQHRYKIKSGDTCYKLGQAFKLTPQELEDMNEGITCSNLVIDREICVWSVHDRVLGNVSCKETYQVQQASTCLQLSQKFSISIDEFRFLNPDVDCAKNVASGLQVCSKSESTQKCSSLVSINMTYSCEDLAQLYEMTYTDFMLLNPTLRCNKLNSTQQVCTGTGLFSTSSCTSSMRVNLEVQTCSAIAQLAGVDVKLIERLNSGIDCSKSLDVSSLVCTSSLGMDTTSAQDRIIKELSAKAPELVETYRRYQEEPNQENAVNMNIVLQKALLKPDVNSLLKELYRTDSTVRTILDSQHPNSRSYYCDQVQTFSETVKSCYCSEDELLLYCQVLAMQEYQRNLDALEEPTLRKKRFAICSISFPGKNGTNVTETEKAFSFGSMCFGGGCTAELGLVEIVLSAELCVPPIKFIAGHIEFCKKDEVNCNADEDNDQALKILTDRSVTAKLEMCAIGSSLLKKIKAAGGGLCWTIISADYYGFIGRLDLTSALNLAVFKLTGGAKIKVTDMAFPKMCERSAFDCEDYCKFRSNNWPNGKAYGFIEGRVLALFGWDGIKIFEQTFDAPKKLGCQKGKEAAVILRNERTCKDRKILRFCWSRDDKIKFGEMPDESGFGFVPWARTVFTCQFTDPNGQMLGFDVYGAKSKNRGKESFYYAVKNDGIYFGKEKYHEDELIAKWDKPCEDAQEEDQNKDGDTGASEPTGYSTVSADECGKRIIGYYTGWGQREISENQLKKLTHVIFAFVAMSADGTVDFGPVSEDDPGPEAGQKAEKRFKDMKEKARKVKAGVRVMFAVGGWDNSQYFSSVAADSGKRSHFINSIADFLTKHGVDGVDIDWEYPVTGGAHEGVTADKQNYVTLLRELRERLTILAEKNKRKTPYLISLASAAGEWTIRPGYDLQGITKYADFINVMTYDYYGAWGSKWGAYTGPPAPLYFGSLKGFSGKLNADFTMKYYSCRSEKPSQLNMGVPFYGRYWENVGAAIDPEDEMWRTASEVGGKFQGGYVAWRDLEAKGWNKGSASFHDKTKSPYIFNEGAKKFLGFENEKSLNEKISYATKSNIGGLMIWAIDLDDESDTLLSLVSSAGLCSGGSGNDIKYECVPIDDVRWWTPENSGPERQGQCGRSAPLIDGYYPVCDPDDPGFACCGAAGYCGSGDEYCKCDDCVDYRTNPKAILDEPIKPSRPIQWYTMDAPDGQRGRCGKDVAPINGQMAICNPDDPTKHCCSNGGYCGTGKEYCECDGCIDYKKN